MHEEADELLDLLAPDLAQLLLDEDREAFVSRVVARFPRDDPGMMRALAGALYRAMPLPGRGFQQEGQAKVGRNEACPCGSGRKYKQCCGEYPEPPLPPADGLLQLVLPHMNRDQWAHFSQHPDMPADYCADLAWHCMHIDKPQKAWEVIKPLSERLDTLGDEHQHAIAYGLDALQALGHDRKRERLMEALCEHPRSRSLRSIGHQRLAMVTMQRDQAAEAREHLEQARRQDPDQLELHLAELSVLPYLVSEAELRERARFWQKRLQKRFGPQYPYQDMVDDIAERGRAAVEDRTGMPVRSIDEVASEPQSDRQAAGSKPEVAPLHGGSGESLSQALEDLGVSPELMLAQQLADVVHQAMGQTHSALMPAKDKKHCALAYDRDLLDLEQQWADAWFEGSRDAEGRPMVLDPEEYEARWQEVLPAWMNWLRTNPELLGSFLVMAEIQRLLDCAPEAKIMEGGFDLDDQLLTPFAMHRLGCVHHLLARWDGNAPLDTNAPVHAMLLACFDETVEDLWMKGFNAAAPRLSEQFLQLMPEDPIGVRLELAEYYAVTQNHEGVEWLYQRYGKDKTYSEIAFARLVQLWRQEDEQAVKNHLKLLQRRFPDDLKMLRKGRLDEAPLGEEVWLMNETLCQFLR